MSTSTVILARILQSVNFSIYRYIMGNTNTVVCSDIGNTNTSIHPVSYCPIWDEAVLVPDLIDVFQTQHRNAETNNEWNCDAKHKEQCSGEWMYWL